MRYIYIIYCQYASPDLKLRGEFSNICFETEGEAKRYCKFHATEGAFYTWEAIQIGKFTVKAKRKKGQ